MRLHELCRFVGGICVVQLLAGQLWAAQDLVDMKQLSSVAADHQTGFTDQIVQAQQHAMQQAKQLRQGLEDSDRARVFRALQQLDQVDLRSVSNPRKVFESLLESLTSSDVEWEDYGIKREIARHMRRFAHSVYLVSVKQHKIVHTNDKEEMLDKLDKALDLIDEDNGPGNGLRFELQTARAMIDALSDTTDWWTTAADSALNLYDAVNDYDLEALTQLVTTCYKAIAKAYNKQWYEVVVFIDYLKTQAVDNTQALQQLQEVLYAYKQKRFDKQSINLVGDCRGDWRILYAGVEALGYVLQHTKNRSIRDQVLNSMDKKAPGLAYYLVFDKFKLKNNWRIRQRAAEALILLAAQNNNNTFGQQLNLYVLQRRQAEKDERVQRVLKEPQILTAVQDALRRKWQVDDELPQQQFKEMMQQQGEQLQAMLKQTLQSELDGYKQQFAEQHQLLQQLQKTQQVSNAPKLTELLQPIQQQLQETLEAKLQQLEDKLETQQGTTASTNNDDEKEQQHQQEQRDQELQQQITAIRQAQQQLQQGGTQLQDNLVTVQQVLQQEFATQKQQLQQDLQGLQEVAQSFNIQVEFAQQLHTDIENLDKKLDTMATDNKQMHATTHEKIDELMYKVESLSPLSNSNISSPTIDQKAMSPDSQLSDLGGKNLHIKGSVKRNMKVSDNNQQYDTNISVRQTAQNGGQAASRGGKNIVVDGDVEGDVEF
ncbi:MAG: hypothetical protein AAF310_05535 [Myxococcota bacterium]